MAQTDLLFSIKATLKQDTLHHCFWISSAKAQKEREGSKAILWKESQFRNSTPWKKKIHFWMWRNGILMHLEYNYEILEHNINLKKMTHIFIVVIEAIKCSKPGLYCSIYLFFWGAQWAEECYERPIKRWNEMMLGEKKTPTSSLNADRMTVHHKNRHRFLFTMKPMRQRG